MNNIQLSASWTASTTAYYSKIFDGNGYRIIGTTGMTSPLINQTNSAIFYRIQFVGFTMTRTDTTAAGIMSAGPLVNTFSNGKMIDVYVSGTYTYNYTGGASGSFQLDVGGVCGLMAAGEIYGVKAQVKLTVNRNAANADYIGGLFGEVRASLVEDCELVSGSTISSDFNHIGGLVGTDTVVTAYKNCKATFAFTLGRTGTAYTSSVLGGIVGMATTAQTFQQCEAYGTVSGTQATAPIRGFAYFGGILGQAANCGYTISYCTADFSSQEFVVTQAAGGIVSATTATGQPSITVTYCYANMKVRLVGSSAGGYAAGIAAGDPTVNHMWVDVNYSRSDGSIIDVSPSTSLWSIAGISTISVSSSGYHGVNRNDISTMTLTTNNAGTYIGGIWASTAANRYCSSMYDFFAGSISGGTNGCIFRGSGTVATSISNSTTLTVTGQTATNKDGAHQAAFTSQSDALTFFDGKLFPVSTGTDQPFQVPTTSPYYPTLIDSKVKSVQQIYVTDYYNDNNTQLNINNFYVYEGGAFIPIWQSYYALANSNSVQTIINMPAGTNTFTFYYKVPDIQQGIWHNVVKIMPKRNFLVPADATTGSVFDWNGDKDDDWVIAYDQKYFLDLVKITNASNYPMPLDGTVFQMWTTNQIYADLTGVDYASWTDSQNFCTPTGEYGTAFLDSSGNPKRLYNGTYVIKEIQAPQWYDTSQNMDRIWYAVVKDGQLQIWQDDPAMSNDNKKLNLGETTSADGYTLTYTAQIFNAPDEGQPYARVRVIKYNEDGSQVIGGTVITDPDSGLDLWTGAIYALEKFDGDNWTGTSHGYGNMIVAGDPNSYCDIVYGYYMLTEQQAPVGYVIDSTPIFISFTEANGLQFKDLHDATDKVGYMDGVQTLAATASIDSFQATDNLGNPITVPQITVMPRDKKPEYKLSLQKYLTGTTTAIPNIQFKLYNDADNSLVGSYTTDASGNLTINLPPVNAKYTLKEMPSAAYLTIPDYQIETKDGAIILNGGPDNYDNVKIIRGDTDGKSYVMLTDPAGFEYAVYPAANPDIYPPDIVQTDDAGIGITYASMKVPNVVDNTHASLQISKIVADTSDTTAFTYTVTTDAGAAVPLNANGVTITKTSDTGTFTATDLAAGMFTITRDTTVFIKGLSPGIYKVTEDSTGYTITYTVGGGTASAAASDTATADTGTIAGGTAANVVFTNEKTASNTPLPFVGGPGTAPFMFSALILSVSLAVFLTGTLIHKYRKRRGCLNRIT